MTGSSNRARYSSTFACIAAFVLLVFVFAEAYDFLSPQHWRLMLILGWAAMLAVMLLIWAARPIRGKLGGHRIGNPTVAMIAGVSAGAIAAVALVLQVDSGVDQSKAPKEQITIMQEQLNTMRSLEAEITRIKEGLNSSTHAGKNVRQIPAAKTSSTSLPSGQRTSR